MHNRGLRCVPLELFPPRARLSGLGCTAEWAESLAVNTRTQHLELSNAYYRFTRTGRSAYAWCDACLGAGGRVHPQADVKVKSVIRSGPSVTLAAPVAAGTVLPPTVELQPLPADVEVGYRPYHYVTWNNRVVLVEPGTRKVVRIID
jgi:hypothetical protein